MTLRRAPFLVCLALLVGWIASHTWNAETRSVESSHARARGGDEPHYLIVLHSVLYDRDLDVKNQYAEALAGGLAAGERNRGRRILHHSYVLDPKTGSTVPWQRVYRFWGMPPCAPGSCAPFEPRPTQPLHDLAATAEIPAHPPAFPLLLAAMVVPFAPDPAEVERYASYAVLALGVATLFVATAAALRSGLEGRAALASTALFGLASPWVIYTRSFFTEVGSTLALALALLAALSGRWIGAGLAVGAAMAIKPVFVVVGAAWLLERALAREFRACVRLASTLLVAGSALLWFNGVVVGRTVIDGGYPYIFASSLDSAVDTLFLSTHGLVVFVPWVVVAAVGLAKGLRPGALDRTPERALRLMALPIVGYFLLLSSYGRVAGACVGPRYWIPFLPWFAIATLWEARRRGWWLRGAIAVLASVSAGIAIPAALSYEDVFSAPAPTGLLRLLGAEDP